jgi:hypothetical protein
VEEARRRAGARDMKVDDERVFFFWFSDPNVVIR